MDASKCYISCADAPCFTSTENLSLRNSLFLFIADLGIMQGESPAHAQIKEKEAWVSDEKPALR